MYLPHLLSFGLFLLLEQTVIAQSQNTGRFSMWNNDGGLTPCDMDLEGPCRSSRKRDIVYPRESTEKRSSRWTPIQIVTPVIVGVSLILICAVAFFIYRRRKNKLALRRRWTETSDHRPRFTFLSTGRRKVREAGRSGQWTIENGESPAEGIQDYEFVSYPATLAGSRSPSGHVRLSSSDDSRRPPALVVNIPGRTPPRRNVDSTFALPAKNIWLRPWQRVSEGLKAIPVPWKRRPKPVKSAPPHARFQIDGSDLPSALSKRSTLRDVSGSPWNATAGNNRSRSEFHGPGETIFEEVGVKDEDTSDSSESDGEDLDAEYGLLRPHLEDEGEESLREDVILISHTGTNFSVDSADTTSTRQVRVIPPTPIAQPPNRQPAKPIQRAHPALPPAPTKPAPLPPTSASPRRAQHQLLDQPSIENVVLRRPQLPPPPLPAPLFPPPPPPPPPSLHPPKQSSSSSRPTTPGNRQPLPPRPLPSSSAPQHMRQFLNDVPDARGRRPILSPPYPASTGIYATPPSSPPSPPSRILSPPYPASPPNSPPPPPNRMFSPPPPPPPNSTFFPSASSSSLHPPEQHLRSQKSSESVRSLIPARTDRVMLFPGSVRGAGYLRSEGSLVGGVDRYHPRPPGVGHA